MRTYKSSVKKHFPQATTLGEFLLKLTSLEIEVLTDAARKGAVWIQRGGKGKTLKIRSMSEKVLGDDLIQLFYEPHVLKLPKVTHAECVYEDKNYGVWIKEAGVVPQGTQTGDHASLIRYVERHRKADAYLVHRLDRETHGLMLLGYNSKAAAYLSDLFQKNEIKKEYMAIVLGEMKVGHKQTITASLDDKEAITHFEVVDSKDNKSLVRVSIETGRLHQIRRHMDSIGHPVMGDPKYGRGNKNREGLKLVASSLSFFDPWASKTQSFSLPPVLSL